MRKCTIQTAATLSLLWLTWPAQSADPGESSVDLYRLKSPDGRRDIDQGSGLHFGRVGRREGLWLVCDRNAGRSANQVFFVAPDRVAKAKQGGALAVSEAIRIVAPPEGWDAFAKRHAALPRPVLDELRGQLERDPANPDGPLLDLEGITIGHARGATGRPDLFVIAEQPSSLVLQLRIDERPAGVRAALVACYMYEEGSRHHGTDWNDGLEGIAYAGEPGVFFLCEEGTEPHNDSFTRLYFLTPQLLRCRLGPARLQRNAAWSGDAVRNVHALRKGSMQTLNALALRDEKTLIAVDRNGGWLLAIDVASRRARRWLNLYDPKLLNLRERLDRFPDQRHMPYVSIEGVTFDAGGDLWLLDDPAMPEGFRASCLIRLKAPLPQTEAE